MRAELRQSPRANSGRINALTVVIVLLVMLLAAGGYWLYQNLESYEGKGELTLSAKARRDPYLAADYFLRALGSTTQRDGLSKQLDRLPADGTVILTTPSDLLTEKQAAALLHWLDAGGNLLVIAGNESESKRNVDPLLGHFGISREYKFIPVDDEDDDSEEADAGEKSSSPDDKPNNKTKAEAKEKEKVSEQLRRLNRRIDAGKFKDRAADDEEITDLTNVKLGDNPKPLVLSFDPSARLLHPAFVRNDDDEEEDEDDQPAPFYWAATEGRVHFAQFESGEGLLTVVSDLDFWTSDQIGKHDHAFTLRQLAGANTEVSLISDTDMPPLSEILWQWAAELWISGVLLLLLWVWHRARRFGPIVDPQLQIRRSLAEHILASATYLWRGDKRDELLAAARNTVLQRARQIFAEFGTLEVEQQVALLHSQTGVDAVAIRHALFNADGRDTPSRDLQLFRDAVGVLQHLNQQLGKRQFAQP